MLALDDLVNNGTIPSISAVAGLRGGRPCLPERSVNLSDGAVASGGPFTLTADYFRIDLADRLTLSRSFELEAAEVAGLLAEGITSAGDLASFRFFTNDLETRTQGLDLVAAWAREMSLAGPGPDHRRMIVKLDTQRPPAGAADCRLRGGPPETLGVHRPIL